MAEQNLAANKKLSGSARSSDRDLEDEVAFHLAMREEKNRREGIAPEEARYAAHRQFGNTTSLKERSREMWTFALAENILRDIRFTARMLLKNPGFTIVAVLTLALGIGANTAIFTLINAVMFRPLPVRDPQKLIQIVRVVDGQDQPLSFPLFEFLAGQMHSIDGAFARGSADVFVNIDGVAQEVSADLVSGGYFPLLGLKPATGRLLEPADDAVQDNAPVAVISFDFWHSRFAEAPEVVGKTLFLGGRLFTIVGVAPQGFTGVVRGRNPDVTFPMSMAPIVWAVGSSWKQEDDHNSLNMFVEYWCTMVILPKFQLSYRRDGNYRETSNLLLSFKDNQITDDGSRTRPQRQSLVRYRVTGHFKLVEPPADT